MFFPSSNSFYTDVQININNILRLITFIIFIFYAYIYLHNITRTLPYMQTYTTL